MKFLYSCRFFQDARRPVKNVFQSIMDSAPKYPRSLHKDSVQFCKALMQKNPKKRLGCDGMPEKGNQDVKV